MLLKSPILTFDLKWMNVIIIAYSWKGSVPIFNEFVSLYITGFAKNFSFQNSGKKTSNLDMCRNATRQKQVDFKPACKAMQVVKLFHILEHLKKTQALKSEHSFENGPFFWARGITWRMTGFSSSLLSRSLKRCYWHFYLLLTSNMIHLLGLSAKKTKLFTYSLLNAHEQNLL